METDAKSKRLKEVCPDVDHWLDPSRSDSSPNLFLDDFSAKARAALSKGQEVLEIQKLSRRNEDLKQQLEDCQHELKTRFQPKLLRGEEQKREGADASDPNDAKVKKRRLSEMENELSKLRQERDLLACELKEAREESHREKENHLKAFEEGQKQKNASEDDLKSTISALESELHDIKQLQFPVAGADAWKSRVSELEQEVFYLRVLLKDWYPEHELASQLRSKHIEFENQLRDSQKHLEDLLHAREKILTLEQEKTSLQAALEIQELSLKQSKDVASESTRTKEDHAQYQTCTAEILHAAQQLPQEPNSPSTDPTPSPTPANLRLAWSRLHSHWTKEAHKMFELQKIHAADKQSEIKAEMSKVHMDMALSNMQSKELQVKLQQSEDLVQKLKAQNSVLREALAGKQVQQVQLQELQELQESKNEALSQAGTVSEEAKQEAVEAKQSFQREAAKLKGEITRLAEVEQKLRKVESVNAELWQANKELERRIVQQSRETDAYAQHAQSADYDVRTTKILHLLRGPQDEAAGSGCDLEQQQAARQLERYKKATKKYVSEFREGLYHLLGWKVEMRGEGNSLRWHLTSRYGQVQQELVFQLRAGRSGQPAEFDLLGTPWAEQLQTDRQAMAYLEVYNSIPGFLAHVTVCAGTQMEHHACPYEASDCPETSTYCPDGVEPRPCEFSDWSAWSEPVGCTGLCTRRPKGNILTRDILHQNSCGGAACEGPLHDSAYCDMASACETAPKASTACKGSLLEVLACCPVWMDLYLLVRAKHWKRHLAALRAAATRSIVNMVSGASGETAPSVVVKDFARAASPSSHCSVGWSARQVKQCRQPGALVSAVSKCIGALGVSGQDYQLARRCGNGQQSRSRTVATEAELFTFLQNEVIREGSLSNCRDSIAILRSRAWNGCLEADWCNPAEGEPSPFACQDKNNHAAGAQDCVMTDWSNWSPCSATCEKGYSVRARQIEAENGGLDCEGSFRDVTGCSKGGTDACPVAWLLPQRCSQFQMKAM
eukprot:Skav228874  [mRNA]  locus=scaffold2395:54418:94387:+ [translate_table: standard]